MKGVLILVCVISVVYCKTIRQTNSAIQDVEDYIAQKRPELNHRYRLHYHVSPPVGWMNDPNGFSYYNGNFHLFYQFYPYDSVWGPMHWGHSISSNLVDWETLPTALVPEQEQCFSGSAVVDGDKLVLIYTGHEVTSEGEFVKESQYLAFSSDGINFSKYEGNPVLPYAPNNALDFRDPKVWKHNDHWYAVIGSATEDKRGRVLLYRSLDLIDWEFLNVLGESDGSMGYMWECPDFFEIDGRFILLWSPQGLSPEGDRYKNLHQTGYIIGSFDYDTFEFVPETSFVEIDYGHDFYASQTLEKDGKRYLVAWFNMWETEFPEAVDGWAGAMTIIRELELVGDRVLMKPVEEITLLREREIIDGDLQPGQVVEFGETGEILITGDLGDHVILTLTGRDGGESVLIKWDPQVGKVIVDRLGDVRQVEWSPLGSPSWRLFLDASSMELFCGEGEVVFSTRVYPDGEWNLTNESPQALRVEAYSLRRSVPL